MKVRLRRIIAASAVLAVLAGCSGGEPPPQSVPLTGSRAPDYVIGPGDTLRVDVYRMPELSAALPVRPDGRMSLPLVPDIDVAGKTPTELAKDIETRLRAYVREPTVSVMVTAFTGMPGKQVRIIGEAAQPLTIPYVEGMSVLDVVIRAGGLTRYASGNRAEIIRRENPDAPAQTIRVRLNDLIRDGDITQDVQMRPGDTLVIPQGWF
ncbi:XrtA/PEP-CTERM system exopolysaccharide export protein [Elioraea sp.]|uniref:XrtA/PEP-CTERM system exopolysaccharide export protein n=1 Tax=Elioraea sp. TaxID=2185103 RepID=UPI0025C6A499|nr:XrtA/PEP-CTERM system exopolysaccharide export protein [Elioraea sp.]